MKIAFYISTIGFLNLLKRTGKKNFAIDYFLTEILPSEIWDLKEENDPQIFYFKDVNNIEDLKYLKNKKGFEDFRSNPQVFTNGMFGRKPYMNTLKWFYKAITMDISYVSCYSLLRFHSISYNAMKGIHPLLYWRRKQ